ncbi:MAG TPA: hypothetical protein VF014_10780, partial [Casimicrobiaceae bacterium]|nr:hypothetical protein [Casimicrobiaceae bacterium]
MDETTLPAVSAVNAAAAARHKPAEVWWFVPELQLRLLSARKCLVRNPMNGVTLELSSGEYAALSACSGCEPLLVHAHRAAQHLRAPPE